MLKSLVPNSIKYPFWYVFKAPQRKLAKGTLQRDVRGVFLYFFRNFRKKQAFRISICVGIANRTKPFLNFVLPSLLQFKDIKNVELSLFDMGSEDFERLEKTVKENWKGRLVLGRSEAPFSRSRAFNEAVKQSTGDVIFLCDADISLPPNLTDIIQQIIRTGVAWFPICYANGLEDNPKTGKWLKWDAKGLVACLKSDFEQVGKLNEKYKTWGGEDVDLWERFHKNGFVVVRQKLKGLVHHYHTPVEGSADYFQ